MNTGSYIDGQWLHPKSARLTRNVNPSDTSDIIAEFPSAGAAEAQAAIEGAERAWASWRKVPAPERGRVVWRAAEIATRRAEEIARTMAREQGKVMIESHGETRKGINVLEYYAGAGFRLQGRTLPSEVRDTFAAVTRHPLGVVGLITPWNFPWAIACWKVAPALVAGNTCVLKPAELTPATATLLVEVFEEAGLPPGCLQLLVGPGSQVGQAIVDHPAVKALSFTGSNAVGMRLNMGAAQRGARVTCEMGGKNALVVMADADLDKAAASIVTGAFGATGQRCTATSRVVVHADVHDALVDRVVERARALRIGPAADPASQLGPAVDEKQLGQDLYYVGVAREEGARLVLGGGRPEGLDQGFFIDATVFIDVTPAMRIFQEEVFGPVLSVCKVGDLDEAIKIANSVQYGLTASIFTRDVRSAMRFVEEVETGMVHVNEPTIGGEAQLPFGGVKATGVGDREMSEDGLNFFTDQKTVFINYAESADRVFIR